MTVVPVQNHVRPRDNPVRRLTRRILMVPLVRKIIGANVVIVAVGFAYEVIAKAAAGTSTIVVMTMALLLASVVNISLIRLALKPVKELVVLAEKVSAGDFAARGEPSPFADRDLAVLGSTINSLLDSLAEERKRIRDLGAEVIYAQDAERARVSRELHDSIAQSLAAVKFQIAVAENGASEDIRSRLAAVNESLTTVTEEIRNVSYTLHPRVAEDLGLESALTTLARQVTISSGVDISVCVSVSEEPIPRNVSSTLYRVAEEALKNIAMHAQAKNASVDVDSGNGKTRIEVTDDGAGFDPSRMDRVVGRSGLASIKDRVVLAGGKVEIHSKPNRGTRVMAELQTQGPQSE